MKNKEFLKQYGFLGIGQCGGNLTKGFEDAGYPCVVANSSTEDLAIRNAKNKFHFTNGQGCHKDRRKSKMLLRDNLEQLMDEIRAKIPSITTLFMCASAAGGTGSGMLAATARIMAAEFNITVCVVVVLPDESENFQSFANTVELFKELEQLDCIGAVFVLDNAKRQDKMKINEIFFTHLDAFLANENGGDYGCLDRSEINKLLETPGMADIAKAGKDNADKMASYITGNNIYAPIEKNKVVRYVGIMTCNNRADTSALFSEIGTPIDCYTGTKATTNICMCAGLSLPKTRLNEIKNAAQTNMQIIKKGFTASEDSLFDDSLDFLGAFDNKPKASEKKKEKSSYDILDEFF